MLKFLQTIKIKILLFHKHRLIWNFCSLYIAQGLTYVFYLLCCFAIVFGIFILSKVHTNAFLFLPSELVSNFFADLHLGLIDFVYIGLFATYFCCLFYYIPQIFYIVINILLGNLINKIFIIIYHYFLGAEFLLCNKYFSLLRVLDSNEISIHILRTFDNYNISVQFKDDVQQFLINELPNFISFYANGSITGDLKMKQIISDKVFELSQLSLEQDLSEVNGDESSWFYYCLFAIRCVAMGFFILIPLFSNQPNFSPPSQQNFSSDPLIHFIQNNSIKSRFTPNATQLLPVKQNVITVDFIPKMNIVQPNSAITIPFDYQMPPNVGRGLNYDIWSSFGIKKFINLLERYMWLDPHTFRDHFASHIHNLWLSPNDLKILNAYFDYLAQLPEDYKNSGALLIDAFKIINERIILRTFHTDPRLFPDSADYQIYQDLFVNYTTVQEMIGPHTLFEFPDDRYNPFLYII